MNLVPIGGPMRINGARLQCREELDASPSTSFASTSSSTTTMMTTTSSSTSSRSRPKQRGSAFRFGFKSAFHFTQNTGGSSSSRLSHAALRTVQLQPPTTRQRPPTPDHLLDEQQRTKVYNRADGAIQNDERVVLSLFKEEEHLASNFHYFTAVQETLTPFHREQAVDWIYDVSKEERCDGDVFVQAVALIDRFLSLQNIFRHDIQILAGVCLFVASKLKAAHPINADKIAYYTDDSCKVNDVLSWELLVLDRLEYETSSPTAFDFFDILVSRLPVLATLRDVFTTVVHKIQKMHKLATLLPSMQCCLSLLYTAETSTGGADLNRTVQDLVVKTFGVQVPLLQTYYFLVEKCLYVSQLYEAPSPLQQQHVGGATTTTKPFQTSPPPMSSLALEQTAEQVLECPSQGLEQELEFMDLNTTAVTTGVPLLQTTSSEALDAAAVDAFFADFDLSDLDAAQPDPKIDLEKLLMDEMARPVELTPRSVKSAMQFAAMSQMTPSTPLNDSGFNSDASSPESIGKRRSSSSASASSISMTSSTSAPKSCRRSAAVSFDTDDDDVTPPKMARFF